MTENMSCQTLREHGVGEGDMIEFGERFLKEGFVDDAIKFFKHAVRLFPESPAICACLSAAYLASGDVPRARWIMARSKDLESDRLGRPNKRVDPGGAR
jgi:hypothetical protein